MPSAKCQNALCEKALTKCRRDNSDSDGGIKGNQLSEVIPAPATGRKYTPSDPANRNIISHWLSLI